jgi:hypothetical protein
MRTRKIRHSALSHQDPSVRNLRLANRLLRPVDLVNRLLRPVDLVNLHRSVNLLPEASVNLLPEASDSLRLELSGRSLRQGNSDSHKPIRLGCNHLPQLRKPNSPQLRSTTKKNVLAP